MLEHCMKSCYIIILFVLSFFVVGALVAFTHRHNEFKWNITFNWFKRI